MLREYLYHLEYILTKVDDEHQQYRKKMETQTETLYQEYLNYRKTDLKKDQFIYILNLFPSLLVCMSDGVLDKEEWDGVMRIADGMAEECAISAIGKEKESLSQIFKEEFKYLLENFERWKMKFLNTLKSYLDKHKEEKEFVLETMYLFANASEGISDVEKETIDELSEKLLLEN